MSSPTVRAARAFLASPRSDLHTPPYGRTDALGLRARGVRRLPRPTRPGPDLAPILDPDPVVTLAEYHAYADAFALGLPAPRAHTRIGTAQLLAFPGARS